MSNLEYKFYEHLNQFEYFKTQCSPKERQILQILLLSFGSEVATGNLPHTALILVGGSADPNRNFARRKDIDLVITTDTDPNGTERQTAIASIRSHVPSLMKTHGVKVRLYTPTLYNSYAQVNAWGEEIIAQVVSTSADMAIDAKSTMRHIDFFTQTLADPSLRDFVYYRELVGGSFIPLLDTRFGFQADI